MHHPPQGDPRSDAELISFVRSGDPSAFGVLYARHASATTSMARYYAKDDFSADDLVSEAFERTFAVLRAGGGPDVSFRAYVYTAVRRLAYEYAERGRRTQVTDDFTPFEMPEEFVDPAIGSFENRMVTSAFAGLPERWQAVLWYLEVEGLKPTEVAVMLGLTANGVSALAYRAREGLREAYLQAHVSSDSRDPECEQLRGKLGAYVNNTLSPRDSAKVEKHLETCAECGAIIAELRDAGHGLRVIIAPLILGGTAAAGLLAGGQPIAASAAAPAVAPTPSRVGAVAAATGAVLAVAGIAAIIALSLSPAESTWVAEPSNEVVSEPSGSATPTMTPTPQPSQSPTPSEPPAAPPRADLPAPPLPVVAPPAPTPTAVLQPALAVSMLDLGDLVLGRDGMLGASVSSTGESDAHEIILKFTLPRGVAVDTHRDVATSGAAWACVPGPLAVTCSTAVLPVGNDGSVFIPVTVADDSDTDTSPTVTASGIGVVSTTAVAESPVVPEGLGTRFVVDGSYSSTLAGASFLSCSESLPGCADAQARIGDPALWDNHAWNMVPVDTAGTGTPSSTTNLDIPVGAEVAFAGLYWSADTPAGESDDELGQLQLRAPGASFEPVTASRVDHATDVGVDRYQAFADLTDLVAAHGGGQWAASAPRITAAPGAYAGWALVVVYADPSAPSGRVAIFDGFEPVVGDPVSFAIAGLADTTVEVGVVAWEGDAGLVGDGLSLDGVPLTRDGNYPDPLNAFTSDAAGSGVANSFGVDVGMFLPATLAAARGIVTASTVGDHYVVGVVAVTTH